MSDALYDTDVVAWSEQQAELLRRAAAGERVNGLDWPNLIEEIESVGRSEIERVVSLLEQTLIHLLKIVGWPDSTAVSHWQAEATVMLRKSARNYRPSMRQHLDLAEIFGDARLDASLRRIDGRTPLPLPGACPLSLDELLAAGTDLAPLIARLAEAAGP